MPGTAITLEIRYWDDRDIDHEKLGNYLAEMQFSVMQHIQTRGDGPLLDYGEDPYRRRGDGFYFIAKSNPVSTEEGQHMTYQYLLDTLIGLFDVLYTAQKPWAAYTNINHGTLGLLGTAVVLPGNPSLNNEATA